MTAAMTDLRSAWQKCVTHLVEKHGVIAAGGKIAGVVEVDAFRTELRDADGGVVAAVVSTLEERGAVFAWSIWTEEP